MVIHHGRTLSGIDVLFIIPSRIPSSKSSQMGYYWNIDIHKIERSTFHPLSPFNNSLATKYGS